MKELFRKVPLFSSLNDEELDAIVRTSLMRTFPRDHIILLEDDDGDTLFIINRGMVKVTTFSEQGKEVIFSILYSGDFFGDMSLLDGRPRSATVVTLEESEVSMLRRADFIKLIEKYPRISLRLLEELTSRLRKADERIESLSLLDVTGRLAGILLQFAQEKGKVTPEGIFIKSRPTHQELANMAGTTRETVTRVLKQLEFKDYIILDGKDLTIKDPARFKADLYL